MYISYVYYVFIYFYTIYYIYLYIEFDTTCYGIHALLWSLQKCLKGFCATKGKVNGHPVIGVRVGQDHLLGDHGVDLEESVHRAILPKALELFGRESGHQIDREMGRDAFGQQDIANFEGIIPQLKEPQRHSKT